MYQYSKKNNIYRMFVCIICLFVVLLILLCFKIRKKDRKTELITEAAPPDTVSISQCEPTAAEENANSILTVDQAYRNSYVRLKNGDYIPDIMSEDIMKSNYRKKTRCNLGKETIQYMSGPRIVINGKEIPDDSFYLEGDYYGDDCHYVICPGCFAACGFTSNEGPMLTAYDTAVMEHSHDYTILVDTLELHTTWEIDRYDPDTNTYYFTVTQNGPFSGTSDIFSSYKKGIRKNTMPKKGNINGVQMVDYDPDNQYWKMMGYNRDDFRYLIDSRYYTSYGRLP